MESKSNSGHNDNFRRTWNKEDYVAKPKPKLGKTKNEFSKEEILKKEKLKARNRKIGKSVVVKKISDTTISGGYFCDVCQCSINDSLNFLDHINGIKHQKNLGMSMVIERSTLDQVKARIEMLKQKKIEQEKNEPLDFEQRVQKAKDK
ncbi:hypothetical protein MXB_4835, partial [Myxobolus squamalis]